ncbi:MAG: hypothetical protein PVJ92_01540 [Candidatus Dependentiae bacterium]|jgi:hypothetical protein
MFGRSVLTTDETKELAQRQEQRLAALQKERDALAAQHAEAEKLEKAQLALADLERQDGMGTKVVALFSPSAAAKRKGIANQKAPHYLAQAEVLDMRYQQLQDQVEKQGTRAKRALREARDLALEDYMRAQNNYYATQAIQDQIADSPDGELAKQFRRWQTWAAGEEVQLEGRRAALEAEYRGAGSHTLAKDTLESASMWWNTTTASQLQNALNAKDEEIAAVPEQVAALRTELRAKGDIPMEDFRSYIARLSAGQHYLPPSRASRVLGVLGRVATGAARAAARHKLASKIEGSDAYKEQQCCKRKARRWR